MTNEAEDESFWGPAPTVVAKKRPGPAPAAPAVAAAAPVTLLELTEPIFQYVCRLNRSAKKGALHDTTQVRADVKTLLSAARIRAGLASTVTGGAPLSQQWALIEPVMLFFVDFMIRSSNLSFASTWTDLAYEKNKEMAGDEKFFDLLDQTLADRSPEAADRISVFYTCIGLGFTGFYTGQPEYLRRKMLECSRAIRQMVDADPTSKICPDAYDYVNTANLIESPQASLIGILIALVGMMIVLFLANGYWYRSASQSLRDGVKDLSDEIHRSPPVIMGLPRNSELHFGPALNPPASQPAVSDESHTSS